MEELKKKKQHERFYFDVVAGAEAYMEVDWNDKACQDSMLKIVIEGGSRIIIRQEDLETLLLALTKDPSRYIRSESRQVGVRYVPVPDTEYRRYKEWKGKKEKYGKKI